MRMSRNDVNPSGRSIGCRLAAAPWGTTGAARTAPRGRWFAVLLWGVLGAAMLSQQDRALATERPLIAVLDLKGDGANLTELETLELRELVRQAALEHLGKTHDVITRESLVDLLDSHGKTLEKCQGECETETGRMLGADIVVTGSIRAVFGRFSVSLKAHSTSPPKVLGIANGTAEEKNSLPDVVSKEASSLLGP